MANLRTIRWGILGCGDVTERKSGPAYQKVEGSALVAVMRRDRQKAESYAARHGVPRFYSDADELIRDPEVDAVYVATPPSSHKPYALKVAQAGKPCCVEKPMALCHAECVEMVEAFERAGQPLFLAYYRRFLPRFLQVKAWVDQGEIGEVRHVHWAFVRAPKKADLEGAPNWRTDPAIAGGGYFVDLASHGLDLFRFLFGEVDRVQGLARNQQRLYPADDAVSACWSFGGGATGSGYWNFAAATSEDDVTVYGSRGLIRFSVFADREVVLETAQGRQLRAIAHPENIQLHHVQAMIEHLNGGRPHASTGESAAKTSLFMDRILRGG